MCFVIKIYLALTSTCRGSKPFSVESTKRENQEKAIKEQRELEAGIPWNITGAERTGEFGHQRVPVQHDERQCLGVSTRFIVKVFMNDQFDKEPLVFPASIACSRLSDSRDDEWVKGTQKYEPMHELGKGGGGGKKEGATLPLPSFFPFIFMLALSQFCGPYYLGAWNRLYFGELTFKAIFTLSRIAFGAVTGLVWTPFRYVTLHFRDRGRAAWLSFTEKLPKSPFLRVNRRCESNIALKLKSSRFPGCSL